MVTSLIGAAANGAIFSAFGGAEAGGLRFSQIGQDTESPQNGTTVQQNTRCSNKRQNQAREGSG